LSVSSNNQENQLYTKVLDWSDDAPTAHDLFRLSPQSFSAILEDPTASGRDFLVSAAGSARSLETLEHCSGYMDEWKQAISGVVHDFPGIRQLFYAAYEAGAVIESLPLPKSGLTGPILWLFEPEWSICIDAAEQCLYLSSRVGQQQLDEAAALLIVSRKSASQKRGGRAAASPVTVEAVVEDDPERYMKAVEQVKAYIAAGDIFQANIARFWHAGLSESELIDLYACLREVNPAPFSCFVKLSGGHDTFSDHDSPYIISASPERLFSLSSGGVVETRPIAGTRRRGEGEDDDSLKAELLLSDKEKAEHIMLVDLERNDLGRICKAGTVEVNEQMTVERYSTVQHIVSNVRGRLAAGMGLVDVFRAMFPGGTITGCPKVHCMEIIHEMESGPRGPYTGGIGYLGWDGSADMNILIRTFWHHQGSLHWAAGAGIVADSDPLAELEETGHKAAGLLRALKVGG